MKSILKPVLKVAREKKKPTPSQKVTFDDIDAEVIQEEKLKYMLDEEKVTLSGTAA